MNYYEIKFVNDHSLMATYLHSFRVERDDGIHYLPTNELVIGDEIWVDIHAFGKDKSYIKTRSYKGDRNEAKKLSRKDQQKKNKSTRTTQ